MLTGKQWIISLNSIIRAISYLSFSFIFIKFFGLGINGLALGYLCGEIATIISNLFLEYKNLILTNPFMNLKKIFYLGLPALPDTIFFWIIVSAPLYFLRRSGKDEVSGYFGLAWKISSSLDIIGNSLATGAARQLIKSSNKMNNLNLSNLHQIFRFSVGVLVILSLGLGLFSPELLRLFFPTNYQPTLMNTSDVHYWFLFFKFILF